MRKQILAAIFSFMLIGSILLLPVSHASAATSKLLYVEYDGATTMSLNSINSDGTGDSVLATDSGMADGQFGVEWSPDGTKIVYTQSAAAGGQWNIFVMNPDGSNKLQLTNDDISGPFGLAWSPDSTKIAFVTINAGPSYSIQSINADGSNRTQLTNSGVDVCPKWTSTNKLAFVSFRDANTEMYTMNADGSSQTNISNDGTAIDGLIGQECAFDVSPDGSKIIYSTDKDGPGSLFELYSMNFDGSSSTRLTTSNASVANGFPAWSSNGSKIAYGSNNHDPGGGTNAYQVYNMGSNGSNQTQLTFTGGNIIVTGSMFGGLRWSPDNSQIAFSSNRSGSPQVFLMNADGSSQTMLVADYSFSPRWQPIIAQVPALNQPPSATNGANGVAAASTSTATLAATGFNTMSSMIFALVLISGGLAFLCATIRSRYYSN